MPRRDLERNHAQLVEHEDSVRDGHHARPVNCREELREALDHGALVDADEDPDEKGAVREGAARRELLVEFRV